MSSSRLSPEAGRARSRKKLTGRFRSVAESGRSLFVSRGPRYPLDPVVYTTCSWIRVTTPRIADDTRVGRVLSSVGCRNSSPPRRARSLARGTRIGLAARTRPPAEDTPYIDRNLPRSGRNQLRRGISATVTRARQGQTSPILRHEDRVLVDADDASSSFPASVEPTPVSYVSEYFFKRQPEKIGPGTIYQSLLGVMGFIVIATSDSVDLFSLCVQKV